MTRKNRKGCILAAACLMLATPGMDAAELDNVAIMGPLFTRGLSGEYAQRGRVAAPPRIAGASQTPRVQRVHVVVTRGQGQSHVTPFIGGESFVNSTFAREEIQTPSQDDMDHISGQLTWRFLRDYSLQLNIQDYRQPHGAVGRETGVGFNATF